MLAQKAKGYGSIIVIIQEVLCITKIQPRYCSDWPKFSLYVTGSARKTPTRKNREIQTIQQHSAELLPLLVKL